MQVPGLLVVGTDTGVGKTYQAAASAQDLFQRGVVVGVYKPVESGTATNQKGDAALLHEAAGLEIELSRVCPQRFAAALAPPVAAELAGETVDEELLIAGAQWWEGQCELLIVEGAGGVYSPISNNWTVLDLAQRLALPVALVAANRLGVVNHTLLSIEAIQKRRLRLLGIVLNTIGGQAAPHDDESLETNRTLLQQFTQIPITDSLTDLIDQSSILTAP